MSKSKDSNVFLITINKSTPVWLRLTKIERLASRYMFDLLLRSEKIAKCIWFEYPKQLDIFLSVFQERFDYEDRQVPVSGGT